MPGVVTSLKLIATEGSQASVAVAAANVGVAGQLMGDTTVGQVIAGGVISCTLMARLQVDVLPQSSVAVQVRVTVYSAGQSPGVVTSANVTATAVSHASVAVAAAKVGTAGQLIGDTTVGQVMAGGVISCTLMARLQVAVLPQSSVAVQVRVTVYSAGQLPGVVTSLKLMATEGSHASVAVAAPKEGVAGQLMGVGDTVGQVMLGGVISCTLMARLQVDVFPQSSVAVQVRVTV